MYNMASDKRQDIPTGKVSLNVKFQCNMCEANFKEKITVEKHMNSKHNKVNCSQMGKFGKDNLILRLM